MDKTAQGVDNIASKAVTLERTTRLPDCWCADFQRHFTSSARNPFFGWNPASRTIQNFRVSDGILDGEFRGLLNREGFIAGTGYLLPDSVLNKLQVDPPRVVPWEGTDTIVIGCNVAHKNYFHWCTQALPAIDSAVSRDGQDRLIRLALPQLNKWQEESLHLLGYGLLPRVTISDPQKQYAFSLTEFSQILNGGTAFALSELLYKTFTRLRQAVEKLPGPPRKLYVARTDAPTRIMRNEAAVIEEMQRRGYEIIVPGALSFTEQVRLFRSAGIIVGPHGAGMTNIIFCEPHTVVYELLSDGYTNACFCNLAMVCQLRYWADAFASEGDPDTLPNLRHWESTTELIVERLNEIDIVLEQMRAEEAQRMIGAWDFLNGKPGMLQRDTVLQHSPPQQEWFGVLARLWRSVFGGAR